jgi:hypothetical protein
MTTNKLTICLLAIPLALTALACPTKIKPGDEEDGGAGTGGATTAAGGAAGSAEGGKVGSGGAGGSKGTGGAIETGGATGTGGVTSTGGVTGTGGAMSTGGMTGTGGAVSTGGMTGTGGAKSTGGVSGTGGAPVTCNPACASTQTCVGTQCLSNDGQTCSLPSQCASKTCTGFYLDVDGDGYGAGSPVGFCGTAAPIGYATQNGDCCDTATNIAVAKLIHPGADFQTTAANVCNITWDYNCSGNTEEAFEQLTGCSASCQSEFQPFPESDCGQQESAVSCSLDTGGTCRQGSGAPQPLGCK